MCQCRVYLMLPVRKIASMTAEPKARAGLMGEPPAYCRRACMQMHECGGGRAGGAVSGVRPRNEGDKGGGWQQPVVLLLRPLLRLRAHRHHALAPTTWAHVP